MAARNIAAALVETGEEAMTWLLELAPKSAEIFYGASETLDSIGYTQHIHHNPDYKNLHDEVEAEADPAKQRELRRLSSVAEYYLGSVQAIAETGEILVASTSGSQVGAYAYGAKHLILVAGTQKICATLDDANFIRNVDDLLSQEILIAGSPQAVREQVQRAVDETGVNYFSCIFSWGDLTHDQVMQSLDLFTREVMPNVS